MKQCARFLSALVLLIGTSLRLEAQTTVFTYQGRLLDGGQPANGAYDLQFQLCDAVVGGNYLGPSLTNAAVPVSNGLFTVTLDFGSAAFDGSARWLELGVCTNGGGPFSILVPRQQLTALPYALYAGNAASAVSLSGTLPASQLTGVLSAEQLPGMVLSNGFGTGVNLSGTFTGDGGGLTNINRLNVKTFGAKGDGQTDDTAAIQAAANALETTFLGPAAVEPVLFFPAGTYLITQSIYFSGVPTDDYTVVSRGEGITLLGAGRGMTRLKWPGDFNGVGLAFAGNPQNGVSLENLSIEGPLSTGTTATGIAFGLPVVDGQFQTYGNRIFISGCAVDGWATGLTATNLTDFTVEKSAIYSNIIEGLHFSAVHCAAVRDCMFEGGYGSAWACGTGIGFHLPGNSGPGDNAEIINCNISDQTNGVYNEELNLLMEDNNLEHNGCHIVTVGLGTLTSINNYILDYDDPWDSGYAAYTEFSSDSAARSLIATSDWGSGTGTRTLAFNVTSADATYNLPTVIGPALPGEVNTNLSVSAGLNSQPAGSNAYNGSFAGDLAGSSNLTATALAPYTLGAVAMDNATWLGSLCGMFNNYSNLNRYGTPNTFNALRNQQPVTVLFEGNGWVNGTAGANFDLELLNLLNTFGTRGFIGNPEAVSGTGQVYCPESLTGALNSPGGPCLLSQTTNWWPGYLVLTNAGDGFWVSSSPSQTASDTYELDWVATPMGGEFTLSTNDNTGSGWNVLTTLNGYSASQQGNVFRWTNSSLCTNMVLAITNTAPGTNNLVAFGFLNSQTPGGITFIQQAAPATSVTEQRLVPEAVKAPIYSSWNPTLILNLMPLATGDGGQASNLADTVAIYNFYATNTPHADVVLCSQFMLNTSANPFTVDNAYWKMQLARTNGWCYFDGLQMGANYPDLLSRGLVAGDGQNLTPAGYSFYGRLLWDWLGLTERR